MLLNKQQIQAINIIKGPCLVLAGAGSGKTSVIVNKIITLINKYGYKVSEIFAVTFTNKAAQEMKERICKVLRKTRNIENNLHIYTFHALGMKIISQALPLLGYKKNYTLFDSLDQIRLMKSLVSQNIRYDHNFLKKIISYISFQKNKIITPEEAKISAVSQEEQTFSIYYQKYNQFLKKYNVFDFDDLIYIAVSLLKQYDFIQYKWQNYIKYLLVDEYQDTNFSQYKLIQLLTGNSSNFTVVGDDDQSIYAWRGANIDNIVLLKDDYPNLKVIKMEHNYRSSKRILRIANILISNNVHVFQKKLFSTLEDGVKIQVLKLQNEYKEAITIVNEILLHKLKHGMNYYDYAILYRTNQQARVFEQYLFNKQIPYFIHGDNSFFNRSEIKNLISYLKFVINQDDNIAFLRIINVPPRKIGLRTVNKIIQYANYHKKSYFHTIQDKNFKNTLPVRVSYQLDQFITWIKTVIISSKIKPKKILCKIIDDIKYKAWLIKNTINDNQKCIKNVTILLDWINTLFQKYYQSNISLDLYTVLIKIVNQFSIRSINIHSDSDQRYDAIQLMTMHASKGLEFPVVFIVGFEEGIIPSYQQISINDISEERRLIYVAITRAKSELTFSFCQKRSLYNKVIDIQPSRFLFELPQNDLIWKNII